MEEKQGQTAKTWDWRIVFAKKNRFLLIGLAGICLIVLADTLWGTAPSGGGNDPPVQETAAQPQQPSSTEQELEERLAGMIGSVQGAGRVRVMVTLENAGETVYATNEKSDTQTSGTADRRTSYENEHVFFEAQEGRQPLVETRLEPEVKGVAVVCEGGDDVTVIRRITDLVSVVLKLPSNRVCFIKMTDTEEAS